MNEDSTPQDSFALLHEAEATTEDFEFPAVVGYLGDDLKLDRGHLVEEEADTEVVYDLVASQETGAPAMQVVEENSVAEVRNTVPGKNSDLAAEA
jgi:hypothetical protein